MIKPDSIQKLKDHMDIEAVIGSFVKIDRHKKACCPFHGEKTPSMSINTKTDSFKCFGCGEGGDALHFVMKHENCTFIDAATKISRIQGIELEQDHVIDKKKSEQERTLRGQMEQVLSLAITTYRQQLWHSAEESTIRQTVRNRRLTRADVAEWQLGWANENWRALAPQLIEKNLFNAAEKLGIVKHSKNNESNYDGYRSRLIIPITDQSGKFIGLAGRYIEVDPADKGKQFPKYINPPENELYNKSKVLFGLNKAAKAIKEAGFAFLVEGYLDVISMHRNGDNNTVATCGTALTEAQSKLLSQYTKHVIILRDGDAPGQAAAIKDLPTLLKAGLKVSVGVLPPDHDPDSYSIALDTYNNGSQVEHIKFQDAVYWYVAKLVTDANGDVFIMGEVKEKVCNLLSGISNNNIRQSYADAICKKYKWRGTDLNKQIKLKVDEDDNDDDTDTPLRNLPEWMDEDELMNNGFCAVNQKKHIGYYGWCKDGKVEITNFLINPLLHIYAAKESRFMIEIDNGRKKAVLDIEAKAMVSIDTLQQYVVSEGAYVIYGNKGQFLRIANHLLQQFPLCREIEHLGWQQHGFFAYVDKVFIPGSNPPLGDGGNGGNSFPPLEPVPIYREDGGNGHLHEIDNWGIIKHNNENHLIPAASAAYAMVKQSSSDPYENQRCLSFMQSQITFPQWAKQMHRVYQQKGLVAIAYTILTIFRDVVFSIDNNCPHLYAFGERSSGKSKWGESIMSFFYKNRQAFNLNSGTDFAFNMYLSQFINCPAALNEADEKVLKPEWFQQIKGAFDGEGRQRGVMGSKNKTEIMKIQSTLILMGQYLMTTDDNSIVSRSIIEPFSERELTEEDKQEYTQLKAWEETGITSLITEVVKFRDQFKATYKDQFNENLSNWRYSLNTDSANFNQRIMQNWCHLYTCYAIINNYHNLPVSPLGTGGFEQYCKEKATHWSSFIRASDTLSEFWNTLAFLLDEGTLTAGWDFKIDTVTEIRLRNNRKEDFTQAFNGPVKIIYIRMNNVHKHYQSAYRQRTGKEAMSMENLLHYFNSRKYYLGGSKQNYFRRYVFKTDTISKPALIPGGQPTQETITRKVQEETKTSSFVFLYDQLGIDIERYSPDDHFSKEDLPL